jgi:hypothetical protein
MLTWDWVIVKRRKILFGWQHIYIYHRRNEKEWEKSNCQRSMSGNKATGLKSREANEIIP